MLRSRRMSKTNDAAGAHTAPVTWIAEEPVVFVRPDGSRASGRIALAAPIFNEQHRHASCAYDLDGMDQSSSGRAAPYMIHGETTLQALLLAASFVGTMLHAFIERGGRVLYPPHGASDDDDDNAGDDDDGETDVALEAIFGPLLTAPRGGR